MKRLADMTCKGCGYLVVQRCHRYPPFIDHRPPTTLRAVDLKLALTHPVVADAAGTWYSIACGEHTALQADESEDGDGVEIGVGL